eukprot:scaffold26900_cov23-Tisochrysis_lutea.AAC.1
MPYPHLLHAQTHALDDSKTQAKAQACTHGGGCALRQGAPGLLLQVGQVSSLRACTMHTSNPFALHACSRAVLLMPGSSPGLRLEDCCWVSSLMYACTMHARRGWQLANQGAGKPLLSAL